MPEDLQIPSFILRELSRAVVKSNGNLLHIASGRLLGTRHTFCVRSRQFIGLFALYGCFGRIVGLATPS